jgi:hypothetical protein
VASIDDETVRLVIDTLIEFRPPMVWSEVGDGIYECTTSSPWDPTTVLTCTGTYNGKTGSYKWQLFCNGQRILALELGDHHNPDCENMRSPAHYHKWRDGATKEKYATPVDFPGVQNTIRGLYWFQRESKISVNDPGPPPGYQRGMLRYGH